MDNSKINEDINKFNKKGLHKVETKEEQYKITKEDIEQEKKELEQQQKEQGKK